MHKLLQFFIRVFIFIYFFFLLICYLNTSSLCNRKTFLKVYANINIFLKELLHVANEVSVALIAINSKDPHYNSPTITSWHSHSHLRIIRPHNGLPMQLLNMQHALCHHTHTQPHALQTMLSNNWKLVARQPAAFGVESKNHVFNWLLQRLLCLKVLLCGL